MSRLLKDRRLSSFLRWVTLLSPRSWTRWWQTRRLLREERKVLLLREAMTPLLREERLRLEGEISRQLASLRLPPSPELGLQMAEQKELLLELLNSLQPTADRQIFQQLGLPTPRT